MGISLVSPKRLQNDTPEDMERIFMEANAIAKRLSSAAAPPVSGDPRGPMVQNRGLRGPAPVKTGAPTLNGTMLRKPGLPNPTSPTSVGPPAIVLTGTGANMQAPRSRMSAPARVSAPNSEQGLKQPRPQGPPGVMQVPPGTRKLMGLQQPPLPRPQTLNNHPNDNNDNTIGPALIHHPALPAAVHYALPPGSVSAEEQSENIRMIRELSEELERWKIEAQEFQQERAAAEVRRKQISNLERDLELALHSLQSAESKVFEAKAQQDTVGIRLIEYEKTIGNLRVELEGQKSALDNDNVIRMSEYERTIENLRVNLQSHKTTQDRILEETTLTHDLKMEGLESRNKELEKKLEEAQHEIDQLELQVIPAELQD
ncbi:hypothetical protein BGZ65_010281, partial [Modicella reniformis]